MIGTFVRFELLLAMTVDLDLEFTGMSEGLMVESSGSGWAAVKLLLRATYPEYTVFWAIQRFVWSEERDRNVL